MSAVATPYPAAAGRGPGKIALIVLGAVLALVATAFLIGAGGLFWAHSDKRDAQGFYSSSTHRFASPAYAITHEGLDVNDAPNWIFGSDRLGTVRIRTTATEKPVFVGIAPAADVKRYLGGVARSEVDDVSSDPFSVDYAQRVGGGPGATPGSKHFWVASATGAGEQTLRWTVREGDWAVVVMNADGSRRVAADIQFGAKTSILLWIALGLLGAGLLAGALAAVSLVFGIRTSPDTGAGGGAVALSAPAAEQTYPVAVEAELDEPLSRWLWIAKWLLAIPHWIVLAFLWAAAAVLTVVAWFAILFTGRYPRAIFDFNLGVLRWTWRVGFYATSAFGTDRYPPFTLSDVDYPARIDVAYPGELDRVTTAFRWLLAIPQLLIVSVFFGGGWAGSEWGRDHIVGWSGGLVGILVFIAGVILLFTGRYPREIFELVRGLNRWGLRVAAYMLLLTDKYPPFRLGR